MSIKYIIYLSIIFFFSEFILMLSKRSKKKGKKYRDDKKSLLIFWVTIPFSLILGFFTAYYGKWEAVNQLLAVIGGFFVLGGMCIRWIAILQLRHAFTVDVSVSTEQRLKTDGLYKYIRHPSYSGLLFICFGLGMGMNSIISLIVTVLPVFAAVLYRIHIEEKILTKAFGRQYEDYKERTDKLLPKVY